MAQPDIDFGDAVDREVFDQILEMDDDDDREFSREMINHFMTQAEETFVSLQQAVDQKDFKSISQLGHFLKGSSMTCGFSKLRSCCEKLERYGKLENLDGSPEPDEELCMQRITEVLKETLPNFERVKSLMKSFYSNIGGGLEF